MTLDEEKELAAKTLMGYPSVFEGSAGWAWFDEYDYGTPTQKLWEPQKDPRCWPEIWKKLEGTDYRHIYWEKIKSFGSEWDLHTIPPKECWKALIEVLKYVEKSRNDNS